MKYIQKKTGTYFIMFGIYFLIYAGTYFIMKKLAKNENELNPNNCGSYFILIVTFFISLILQFSKICL